MPETLLSPSTVLLYGRELVDIQFNYQDPRPGQGGNPAPGAPNAPPLRESGNNFLEQQLLHGQGVPAAARLARIYGFSFEGYYYDLARPAIFLVHGPGDDPEPRMQPAGPPPPPQFANPERSPTGPHGADFTGTANQDYSFAEDMRVWPYDKDDFSIRLDMVTGPFEQILLDAELVADDVLSSTSGAHARVSGAHARVSGAHARVSGAHARISGAHARIRGNRGGD